MTRRDQELLDKQLRAFRPEPRHDGVLMLALVVVFFTGMTFGSVLADKGASTQVGPNNASTTIALLSTASNAPQ
jgi:hypothetical protein